MGHGASIMTHIAMKLTQLNGFMRNSAEHYLPVAMLECAIILSVIVTSDTVQVEGHPIQ